MSLSRRRFIAVSLSLISGSVTAAEELVWNGRGFGADLSIKIRGTRSSTLDHSLIKLRAEIAYLESVFSLYDPDSEISKLNRNSFISEPSKPFIELLEQCRVLHSMTNGIFDPTIQALWHAMAWNNDIAKTRVGFEYLSFNPEFIKFKHSGMSLTLNGIAQGYATDRIAALARKMGFQQCLINIGEIAALGGPWHVGVENFQAKHLAVAKLQNNAIATSSSDAMRIGKHSHILNPVSGEPPSWKTVSVQTNTATLADGLSTAMVFLDRTQIAKLAKLFQPTVVLLEDFSGKIIEIR